MERRRSTREFRLEAVRLIKECGVSYAQAAEDLGVHPTQLRNWVKKLADDPEHAFPGQGQMKPEQLEVAQLKREVAKLKAKRDILKNRPGLLRACAGRNSLVPSSAVGVAQTLLLIIRMEDFAMPTKRIGDHPELKPVNVGVVAIDIGSKMNMAAVNPACTDMPVRAFGTFTQDLHDLADWFKACGVASVAMECTGVYWIPVCEILEQRGFEVILVNARYAKNVPGRKTDVSDAAWLRQLHSYGLLRGSFRPDAEIATLRAYLHAEIGDFLESTGAAIRWRSGNVWDSGDGELLLVVEDRANCAQNVPNERRRQAKLFDYIERFYNPKGRHSTIGYISPMEFERVGLV